MSSAMACSVLVLGVEVDSIRLKSAKAFRAPARNMRCHASVSPPKPQESLVGFQVFVSNRNHSEDSSEYFLSLKPCAIFDWRNLRWLDLRPTAPKHVRI